MYSTPVSEITTADLQVLQDDGAAENVRLEFKREPPSKNEMLKKLTSFANTFGGDLIVGVEEDNDGCIKSIPGIDLQNSYRQKVTQWCFDGASPPLTVEVSDPIASPVDATKFCYVLRISESENAPYFINGRRGVYVRTNEQSQKFEARLAEQPELLSLLDRRKIIVERRVKIVRRASARFRKFAVDGYAEYGSNQKKLGASFELSIVPKFPATSVLTQTEALDLVTRKKIGWRQTGFPRGDIRAITQNESAIVMRPGSSFSILELNTWGLMFYATEIGETRENWAGIHLNKFVSQLLVFCRHAKMVIEEVNLNSDLNVDLKFEDIQGVPWVYFEHNAKMPGPSSPLDDSFEVSLDTSTEEICRDPDSIVKRLLGFVMYSMNWSSRADGNESQEELIRLGRNYNMWE